MLKFLKRTLLFSIPISAYVVIALIIDPYNVINDSEINLFTNNELEIPYKLNYPLYQLNKYSNNPADVVFLGDSRTQNLDYPTAKGLVKGSYINMAYGGGTIPEITETFWHIVNLKKPKEVYIGINFELFNEFNNMNRVDEALELSSSIPSYIFSKYCFKSVFLILKNIITPNSVSIGEIETNKNEFWSFQIEKFSNDYYKNYRYSLIFLQDLSKVSNFCKKEKIKLTFFIPPTSIDIIDLSVKFNLEKKVIQFEKDISSLADTYNFNYPNILTKNKDNFDDPVHINKNTSKIILSGLLENNNKYVIKTINGKKN
tara:strand:- start:205 stop:1149 length:945 start_codon:yes stop_codon:yes gene_type:complete